MSLAFVVGYYIELTLLFNEHAGSAFEKALKWEESGQLTISSRAYDVIWEAEKIMLDSFDWFAEIND